MSNEPQRGIGGKVDIILDEIRQEDVDRAEAILSALEDRTRSAASLTEELRSMGLSVGYTTVKEWRRRRLGRMLQPAPEAKAPKRPKSDSPSREIDMSEDEISVSITDSEANATVGTARDYLEAQGQDPDAWQVSRFYGSERELASGETLVSNKWIFIPSKPNLASKEPVDLDDLHAFVQRTKPQARLAQVSAEEEVTKAAIIADLQWGKTGERGDSSDTLARVEDSLANFHHWLSDGKPGEIILADGGDIIENFESTSGEDRTNDLELTEQIRIARRVQWLWIAAAAEYGVPVWYLSVGSNHCRIRRGKNNMGTSRDDLGIEIASQLQDMADVYPERYGHVSFRVPTKHEESLSHQMAGGKTLGLIHGHQVNKPEGIPNFLAGQAAGETPIGLADFAVFNHFHHWRVSPWGKAKWYCITPTSDNGSDWYRNTSGQESSTAVVGLTFDSEGWDFGRSVFL